MTYFFHIRNTDFIQDLEGSELSDIAAVKVEARAAALDLLRDGIRHGAEWRDWRMEVADPSGKLVLDLSLNEAASLT